MRPDPRFKSKCGRFWAYVKFLSEQAGYSKRKSGVLRTYAKEELLEICSDQKILPPSNELLLEIISYMNWRADLLNLNISKLFMDRAEAERAFIDIKARTLPTKALPMNKQKGEKRHHAYLACIVAMIAEHELGPSGFIDDARRLSILTSADGLERTFSRRFDGAIPDTRNPIAVWEIKEYYGTTTFGSRVADGVYETLLDGYEIELAQRELGASVFHFLFIDDRYTWWDCGKSYLCRMIDMLHTGHVDQIFFGKEVLTEWRKTLIELKTLAS
ncbi:hypothetical protein [Synechococcus sp. FACHB-909]|uniref:DUF7687 domain-containing protein n=1 Tax=Synechococcus sp. FACHB-909 TaxID=2692863 RepID=UPI0016821BCC|nr:hypothetical protein [Synechococcus sp. FACHB-909]MBD2720140.1 hypothetical protein [Synechococcus sp. FACHB-909]